MATDIYARVAATALRQITSHGTAVILKTYLDVANTTDPMGVPDTVETTTETVAVLLPVDRYTANTFMIKKDASEITGSMIAYLPGNIPQPLPGSKLIKNTVTYEILTVNEYAPGNTVLLYTVELT